MTNSTASPKTSASCRATNSASLFAVISTACGDMNTPNRSAVITARSFCKRWKASSRHIPAAGINPIQICPANTPWSCVEDSDHSIQRQASPEHQGLYGSTYLLWVDRLILRQAEPFVQLRARSLVLIDDLVCILRHFLGARARHDDHAVAVGHNHVTGLDQHAAADDRAID